MQRVGLIGLGRMGSRLARRLADAGISLKVFDVDPEKTKSLAGPHIQPASSAAETVTDVDALITMVTDGSALLAGTEFGAALPIAGTALPLYQAAANMGWSHLDTSSIVPLLEALDGLALAPR